MGFLSHSLFDFFGATKVLIIAVIGFGGSADTRTNASLVLGKSLLQHQHAGILPSVSNQEFGSSKTPLPLNDPFATSMPEAWVRAAILIRMNSLIRGHSGVRWKFIEALGDLLCENITPFVPLRGSISASGGETYFYWITVPWLMLQRDTRRSLSSIVRCWDAHRQPVHKGLFHSSTVSLRVDSTYPPHCIVAAGVR